jgi:hypothetical protein
MWIYLNKAFLSIVEDATNPDLLIVRSRHRGDIRQVFNDASVEETPRNDYAFRARIDRETVAIAMARAVLGIHYNNFKNSVPDDTRRSIYSKVWNATLDGFGTGLYSELDLFGMPIRYDNQDEIFNDFAIREEEKNAKRGKWKRKEFGRILERSKIAES